MTIGWGFVHSASTIEKRQHTLDLVDQPAQTEILQSPFLPLALPCFYPGQAYFISHGSC